MLRKPLLFFLSLFISPVASFASVLQKPFPHFEGEVRVPVGNHGSASVAIIDQSLLKTTDSYGPRSEEITLDLASGLIELTTVDFTPQETVSKSSFAANSQGASYLPYRQQLQAMISDMVWINENLSFLGADEQMARKPEMAAVLNYLNELLSHADAVAPDSVSIRQAPRDLRRGITYMLTVEYLAREERDVLLEVFDAQWRYLGETRLRVPVGLNTVDISLAIPADAPLDQNGFVTARILPVDGVWSNKLAEVQQEVKFRKTQMITSHSTSWFGSNGARVAFYLNYYCPGSCEIRVDIFDQQGQWLSSRTVEADAAYVPNAEQFTRILVNAPTTLAGTQTYTYYVKLLPQGGSWDKYFDEVRGTFKTIN